MSQKEARVGPRLVAKTLHYPVMVDCERVVNYQSFGIFYKYIYSMYICAMMDYVKDRERESRAKYLIYYCTQRTERIITPC